jgi:hypothetical protein
MSLKRIFLFSSVPPVCKCYYNSASTVQTVIWYAIFKILLKVVWNEMVLSQNIAKWIYSFNNLARILIKSVAFTVPKFISTTQYFFCAEARYFLWKYRIGTILACIQKVDAQVTTIYLAPDIIPGKNYSQFRYSEKIDSWCRNSSNATDLFQYIGNKKQIQGQDFYNYIAFWNYYETQVKFDWVIIINFLTQMKKFGNYDNQK